MKARERSDSISVKPKDLTDALGLWEDFEDLLGELATGHAYKVRERPAPPIRPGVYVFSTGGVAVHVGRTNNLQRRRRDHTLPKNRQATASFSFRIAIANAKQEGMEFSGTRAEIEADPQFEAYFRRAKADARTLDFRCVEIHDPAEQAMFEIFATVALGLPRHLVDNH